MIAEVVVLCVLGLLALVLLGVIVLTLLVARRVERMVPRDGTIVTVNGASLHVLDRGTGPALLLIHGLGGQMRNFAPLVDLLVEHHRVVLVDRPGCGYSRLVTGPQPSLAVQARMVADLVASLGLDRPVVVGHSLGGALALTLAVDHPERVGGLALLAPLTQPGQPLPVPFRRLAIASPLVRRLVAWTAATPLALLAGTTPAVPVFAPEAIPRDFAVRGGGALGLRPSNFEAASADLVAADGSVGAIATRYGDMTLPVEILYGADDRILDPARQGAVTAAAIAGARYHVIPGGHMIPYTQPAVVAEWVTAAARRCREAIARASA